MTGAREVKEESQSRELVLIGIVSDEGIFNERTLSKVADLSFMVRRLEVTDEGDAQRIGEWAQASDSPYREEIASILVDGLGVADRGPVDNLWLEVREAGGPRELLSLLDELRLKLRPVAGIDEGGRLGPGPLRRQRSASGRRRSAVAPLDRGGRRG